MYIQRKIEALSKYEYGCDLRRLYPSQDLSNPLYWGSAIASVRPGECTTPHKHDELETFIVLAGKGRMYIEAEEEDLEAGDVVFIPREQTHRFQNLSNQDPLTFITIFWDSPEAREQIKTYIDNQT
ncbi:AraC-like ligand binding protein, partial [Moorena producens 3L]